MTRTRALWMRLANDIHRLIKKILKITFQKNPHVAIYPPFADTYLCLRASFEELNVEATLVQHHCRGQEVLNTCYRKNYERLAY